MNRNIKGRSVALVVSQFNRPITEALKRGACERLLELGCLETHYRVIEVPGAVEIPIVAQRLCEQGRYDAIIALGAVIRGETTHYDYVCLAVTEGCMRVSLKYNIPVIFGVLTTENEEQAWDRLGGAHGHKGRDAADCAWDMLHLLETIE